MLAREGEKVEEPGVAGAECEKGQHQDAAPHRGCDRPQATQSSTGSKPSTSIRYRPAASTHCTGVMLPRLTKLPAASGWAEARPSGREPGQRVERMAEERVAAAGRQRLTVQAGARGEPVEREVAPAGAGSPSTAPASNALSAMRVGAPIVCEIEIAVVDEFDRGHHLGDGSTGLLARAGGACRHEVAAEAHRDLRFDSEPTEAAGLDDGTRLVQLAREDLARDRLGEIEVGPHRRGGAADLVPDPCPQRRPLDGAFARSCAR